MTEYSHINTPIGPLLVARDDGRLHTIQFARERVAAQPQRDWRRDDDAFADLAHQLREYFLGSRQEFELDVDLKGTPFQLDVWSALRAIPYGQIRSYSDIARVIGRPKAVRAVGAANGANPVPIIVPCHRVIGANGALTGFGGGLSVKRRLLELERGERRLID